MIYGEREACFRCRLRSGLFLASNPQLFPSLLLSRQHFAVYIGRPAGRFVIPLFLQENLDKLSSYRDIFYRWQTYIGKKRRKDIFFFITNTLLKCFLRHRLKYRDDHDRNYNENEIDVIEDNRHKDKVAFLLEIIGKANDNLQVFYKMNQCGE